MHRTQIYLDEHHERALAERGRALGRTRSALIREAIDAYLQPSERAGLELDRFRAAVREAQGAAPYLPAGPEYVEELRSLEQRRERELERRRGA